MKIVAIGSVKFSKIVFSYLLKKKIKIHTIFGKKKSNLTQIFWFKNFFKKKLRVTIQMILIQKTISILKKFNQIYFV